MPVYLYILQIRAIVSQNTQGPHQLATLHFFQAKAQFTNWQSDSVIYLLGQIIRYDKAGWYIHGLQKHPAANNSLIMSRGCEEPLATVLRAHLLVNPLCVLGNYSTYLQDIEIYRHASHTWSALSLIV